MSSQRCGRTRFWENGFSSIRSTRVLSPPWARWRSVWRATIRASGWRPGIRRRAPASQSSAAPFLVSPFQIPVTGAAVLAAPIFSRRLAPLASIDLTPRSALPFWSFARCFFLITGARHEAASFHSAIAGFTEVFIRRAVATTLVMAAIVLFGVVAYRALPVSDLPNSAAWCFRNSSLCI